MVEATPGLVWGFAGGAASVMQSITEATFGQQNELRQTPKVQEPGQGKLLERG